MAETYGQRVTREAADRRRHGESLDDAIARVIDGERDERTRRLLRTTAMSGRDVRTAPVTRIVR